MQPSRTEAIKAFLEAKTHPDLAAMYHHDMECQVNVAADGGDRIEGNYQGRMWHGYSDGVQTWKSFRIPYDAKGDANYDDPPMSFDLVAHAEGIGCTGWDWKERRSRWLAFDFDGITGHSEKHGNKLTDAELDKVREAASAIPWVTVRKSTSGRGLHLYVEVDVPTANHNEHAALGRAVLSEMSGLAGFDFKAKVDICGGNMWLWHRKMVGTDGLSVIKHATHPLTTIPPNWRDHIDVIRNTKQRITPAYIKPGEADEFQQLTGHRTSADLEPEHVRLIEWLTANGHTAWWENDHRALVTHTHSLMEAHKALGYKGYFNTASAGREQGDHNCFCFAMRKGAWSVRRFSQGCREAESWTQDGNGWTMCYLNADPDLRTVARAYGGLEAENGAYKFKDAETAAAAARQLGTVIDIPSNMLSRPASLKPHKDGRVIVDINKADGDAMPGWLEEKNGTWRKILNAKVGAPPEAEIENYDDLVRHVVTEGGYDSGWAIASSGHWRWEPLVHVKAALGSSGVPPKQINNVIGQGVLRCWTLVNKPFQPEYPGEREWNHGAAKLRFTPSESETLSYPTWLRVLKHCGSGLDKAISTHGWCQANGILNGGDYLMTWCASLFQHPEEPLPYLFFYGEQNCGKSTFHESLSRLLDGGYQRADSALKNQFNGELDHAILCAIEETDLRESKGAYNRLKDYVVARQISIHKKNETPFLIRNTTHWVQCGNKHEECPIFSGDSRITICRVPNLDVFALDPEQRMIPRKELERLLDKEAPDFLAALMRLEVPPTNDRLNIPIVETDEKKIIQQTNATALQAFLDQYTYAIPGECILVSDFCSKFHATLDPEDIPDWSKIRIGREMPLEFPKGRITSEGRGGQFYYGNISFENVTPNGGKWIRGAKNDTLVRV